MRSGRNLKPMFSVSRSLRSREGGECGSFFGGSRKTNHLSSFLRERSERKKAFLSKNEYSNYAHLSNTKYLKVNLAE